MKTLKLTFFTIIFLYLSGITYLTFAQTKYIFFPEKLDSNYTFENQDNITEEVFIKTTDNETINGLFFKANSEKVILYFHGNAGSLKSWQYIYTELKPLGYNILIIDYRGYGKSTGKISEKGLYTDAQSAYNYLINKGFKESNIVIFGRSIGTGVAVDLAKNNPTIHSLILETPYLSLKSLANEYVSFLLPSLWLNYKFDNKMKINDIKAPILILHGTADEVIPYNQGKSLFDERKSNKQMMTFPDGKHNNLSTFPNYISSLKEFLAK